MWEIRRVWVVDTWIHSIAQRDVARTGIKQEEAEVDYADLQSTYTYHLVPEIRTRQLTGKQLYLL